MIGRLFVREPRGYKSASVREVREIDDRYLALKTRIKELKKRGDVPDELADEMNALRNSHEMMTDLKRTWTEAKDAGKNNPAKQREEERTMTERARMFLKWQEEGSSEGGRSKDDVSTDHLENLLYKATEPPVKRQKGERLDHFRERQAKRKTDTEVSRAKAKQFGLTQADCRAILLNEVKNRKQSLTVSRKGKLTAYGRRRNRLRAIIR